MPGSARSCPQIHSRYGSSFDTAGDRAYLGGDSAANARRIVLRCSPVRLLISRIDNRSTRCMRLISAHCCTPTTPSSSPDHRDQARVRTRPDEPTPRQVGHFSTGAGGPLFTRRPHLPPGAQVCTTPPREWSTAMLAAERLTVVPLTSKNRPLPPRGVTLTVLLSRGLDRSPSSRARRCARTSA